MGFYIVEQIEKHRIILGPCVCVSFNSICEPGPWGFKLCIVAIGLQQLRKSTVRVDQGWVLNTAELWGPTVKRLLKVFDEQNTFA